MSSVNDFQASEALVRSHSQTPEPSIRDIQLRVGRAIRHRRRLVDLTLSELAEMCGVSFQQVQKYEAGVCSISAAQLWTMACALHVPVGYFFEGVAQARI